MTDLHTHILPGMDDGPKSLPDAMALVERAALQGVDHIALISHFSCENESVEAFLARREIAFSALRKACPKELTLKRGCEVYFSPRLLTENAEELCLEGAKVLLLELPVLQKPAFLREVLTDLVQKGITPLIAHVERGPGPKDSGRLGGAWRADPGQRPVLTGWGIGPEADQMGPVPHRRQRCPFYPASPRQSAPGYGYGGKSSGCRKGPGAGRQCCRPFFRPHGHSRPLPNAQKGDGLLALNK